VSSSLSREAERLAWIFGSSRSGSTWLLRMLAELDGIVPIDDPHLGHHLGVWRPIPLAWAAAEDEPELSTLLEVKAEEPDYFFSEHHRESWWEPLRALIQARFGAQVSRADAAGERSTVVVKEPGSHVAPLLAELFPSSKLIFLLRDGRDVVDSWLDAYQEGSWAISGGAFPVSAEGRIPLIRWLSAVWVYRSRAVRRAFETREPGDRILIHYERLRIATEETMEQVCEVLELDRGGLTASIERHRFERLPGTDRGAGCEQRLATPGAWQERLSAAEQEAMHEVLGEALREFGYAPDPVPVG
jgi:ribosomal protein L34E